MKEVTQKVRWFEPMLQRTRVEKTVFPKPFQIDGYERQIPAGTYSIEISEELIQELSFPAYRRVATTLLLPALPNRPGGTVFLSVTQADLDAALNTD
jgi:hypothetical protein